MPLWTDAYLGDTGHLTTIEHGAYMLLLMTMWRAGASLPNDEKLLAKYARLNTSQWRRMSPSIMPFFKVADGRITQGRLSDEYEAVKQRGVSASNSAKARWLKTKDTPDAVAMPIECEPDATIATTISIDKKEKKEPPLSPKGEKPSRASQLPDGWVLSEKNQSDAIALNFTDKEIQDEADRFSDHHRARGSAFKDWDAAWRTWLRNARKFAGSRVAGQRSAAGYGQGGGLAGAAARRWAEN